MALKFRNIRTVIFLSVAFTLLLLTSIKVDSSQAVGYYDKLPDFYEIRHEHLEQGWRQVAGPNNANIPFIKESAQRYNIHPLDLATVLLADTTCRIAWPGGMPVQIPHGFTFSHTGISQIPPSTAVARKLIESGHIVPGARNRYHRYTETIIEPEQGVDYWFRALSEEAYEAMHNPSININVAARYLRRVYDDGLALWMPDARDSIKLDDRSLLPQNYIRWVDEFDWRQVRNYMRNHMLWDHSYEFDLTEFHPENSQRLSELSIMLVYSEYRTSPPFDGSWFFEAMKMARESSRWLNTRDDIKNLLEPDKEKRQLYIEYIEDYSFFQNEFEILNPHYEEIQNRQRESDDKESQDRERQQPARRPPRGSR